MKVFVRVAQHMGFAAAARELRMSTPAVSKHVTALESRIGTRLFDRTTRKVALTEAGRLYLERCLECLQAFEDADASVGQLVKDPRGLLRVTAPIDFGDIMLPVVVEVMNANPNLVVDLRLSNRVVDMVEEGVDVGIRVAPALEGNFVARPLARARLAMFGAPEYFRRHGRPRRPEEIAAHRNLVFVEPRPMEDLVFVRGRQRVHVRVQPVMTSNLGSVLTGALRGGVGIAPVPSFLLRDDVEHGRLEPILLDWSLREFGVYAVYPHRRFLSPKVRVFVEAMRSAFGDGTRDPWWPRSLESRVPGKPSRRTA